MEITSEMVMKLNNELENKGYPFKYEYNKPEDDRCPYIKITLTNMKGVNNFIINPTDEFFDWLNLWFKLNGVELYCNNDKSILWGQKQCDISCSIFFNKK